MAFYMNVLAHHHVEGVLRPSGHPSLCTIPFIHFLCPEWWLVGFYTRDFSPLRNIGISLFSLNLKRFLLVDNVRFRTSTRNLPKIPLIFSSHQVYVDSHRMVWGFRIRLGMYSFRLGKKNGLSWWCGTKSNVRSSYNGARPRIRRYNERTE